MKPFRRMSRIEMTIVSIHRHSSQAQREPESSPAKTCPSCDDGLDSRPGLLAAGVTFFRGNDVQEPDDTD